MMGINVTTLPEEPVDQIIGMMLYYKLNAIMEGRMIVQFGSYECIRRLSLVSTRC
jgi:hypothetical protein